MTKTLSTTVLHNGTTYEKGTKFDPKNDDHKELASFFGTGGVAETATNFDNDGL